VLKKCAICENKKFLKKRFQADAQPVDEADEIVDGRLGAAAAHFVEEAVVGHQE
jgi:hypothetical protein